MHVIKILGTGCRTCVRATQLLEQLIEETGAPARVVKVEDLQTIMSYGVMATPGIVLDEEVIHVGMPSRSQALEWLAALREDEGEGQAPGAPPRPRDTAAPTPTRRRGLLGRLLKR